MQFSGVTIIQDLYKFAWKCINYNNILYNNSAMGHSMDDLTRVIKLWSQTLIAQCQDN